jgi:hypothetical protein
MAHADRTVHLPEMTPKTPHHADKKAAIATRYEYEASSR